MGAKFFKSFNQISVENVLARNSEDCFLKYTHNNPKYLLKMFLLETHKSVS